MYASMDTAPPSVLKLPVDWPAIKIQALPRRVQPVSTGKPSTRLRSQRSLGDSATLGAEASGGLASDQSTSAIQEYLSSPVLPSVSPHMRQDGYSTARKSSPRSSPLDAGKVLTGAPVAPAQHSKLRAFPTKTRPRSHLGKYIYHPKAHRHRA
jgi:hypothetical protein